MPGVGAVFSIWLKFHFDKGERKRKEIKNNDMEKEYARKGAVQPILDSLFYEMSADRVYETSFSNGDTTFSGVHLKKLSIIAESPVDHQDPLTPHFQLVPAKKFQRNLDLVHASTEDFYVFYEEDKIDELGALNRMFDLNTILCVKIRNDQGMWIGLLSVVWKEHKQISSEMIAFTKLKAAQIGLIK